MDLCLGALGEIDVSDRPLKLFISYAHDSREHDARVLELANRLRTDGFDCDLDQFHSSPPEGWPKWMDRALADSDFVLIVISKRWHDRCMDKAPPGKGLGVRWESTNIYHHIYEGGANNTKFIPVLFDDAEKQWIPKPLGGATRYVYPKGYGDLLRQLEGIPPATKAPIGKRPRGTPPGSRTPLMKRTADPDFFTPPGTPSPGVRAVFRDHDSVQPPIEKQISADLEHRVMLAHWCSYCTNQGTEFWIALCGDLSYEPFTDSLRLVQKHSDDLFGLLGTDSPTASQDFISLGPGDGQKDRELLRALLRSHQKNKTSANLRYYPLDISHRMLDIAEATVKRDPELQPWVTIQPLWGRFENLRNLAPCFTGHKVPRLFSFLGNTLGNVANETNCLREIKAVMESGDTFLLEVRQKLGTPVLSGENRHQFGLSFAPLARLGVKYDESQFRIKRVDGRCLIPGTVGLGVFYDKALVGGHFFRDIFLSCVKYYDLNALKGVLEGEGFTVVRVFKGKVVALFVARKR